MRSSRSDAPGPRCPPPVASGSARRVLTLAGVISTEPKPQEPVHSGHAFDVAVANAPGTTNGVFSLA